MRFKKLKTTVAVSMIVFILLVGSIVALGVSERVQSQKSNSASLKLLEPTYPNQNTQVNTNTQTNNVQTQPTPTPVQTQQTIFNTVRTRAS